MNQQERIAQAQALLDQAMQDGINVHGAIAGLIAAQSEPDDETGTSGQVTEE